MKITNITTESYRWPRHKPITNGKHNCTHAGVGFAKIETDLNSQPFSARPADGFERTAHTRKRVYKWMHKNV